MTIVYALTAAVIIGCALFMVLSRNLVRILLGLTLLSTGVNVALFITGGIGERQPPLIREGEPALAASADPLVQALILTAIVIGFALTIILATVALRAWRDRRSLDVCDLKVADRMAEPPTEIAAK